MEDQLKSLCIKIEALEKMVDEREAKNKERFESILRATDLAHAAMEKRLDAMNEFRDTLKDQAAAFISRSEVQRLMQDVNHMGDRFTPRDVYEVQHAQVWKQVEINTGRLYDVEKFIASQRSVKQEEREKISTTYYSLSIAGVLFAVVISVVTVWFNIGTYNAHGQIAATISEVEAGDKNLKKQLDALTERLNSLQK